MVSFSLVIQQRWGPSGDTYQVTSRLKCLLQNQASIVCLDRCRPVFGEMPPVLTTVQFDCPKWDCWGKEV